LIHVLTDMIKKRLLRENFVFLVGTMPEIRGNKSDDAENRGKLATRH
jgi:hypothetical protein